MGVASSHGSTDIIGYPTTQKKTHVWYNINLKRTHGKKIHKLQGKPIIIVLLNVHSIKYPLILDIYLPRLVQLSYLIRTIY